MLSEIQAPLYGKGSLQWTFEPFEPCNAVMSGILTRLTCGWKEFYVCGREGKIPIYRPSFFAFKGSTEGLCGILAAGESEFHESKPVERTEASKVNPLLKSY